MNTKLIILLIAISMAWSCKPPEDSVVDQDTTSLEGVVDLVLPEGFKSTVVVDGLGKRTRHIVVSPEGEVYAKMESLDDHGGVVALKDTNGDGKLDVIGSFGNYTGTEVALYNGYLYASSDTAIYRYKLQTGSTLPDTTSIETVIGGFKYETEHASKTFTFDGEGHIYVNVGAPSNACQKENRVKGSPGMDPCPILEWQGGIWQFDANKTGQTQHKDGRRYCTGIRNIVALDWDMQTNSLYAVQHGRDQLAMLFPDLFDNDKSAELPAEEFFQISDGDDFGWPYCYFDHLQGKKVLAPEYGGDGKTIGRCEGKKSPIMGFPGHMAPNDLLFYTGDQFPERYKKGAFIAFHGSWNRAPLPQKGFFVVFVPMADGKVTGEWEIFADGFSGLDTVGGPGDAMHRPVGLAQGPDGSLYVSDSQKGRIWKIQFSGEHK